MLTNRNPELEVVVRRLLYVWPVLIFIGMASTAVFSSPSGPGVLGYDPVFSIAYGFAAILAIVWGAVNRTRLRTSSAIGLTLAVFALFRSFTVFEARTRFGSVAYSAVANWQVYALLSLMGTTLSVAYIVTVRETPHDG